MTVSASHALQPSAPFHGQVRSRSFSEFAAGQVVSVKVLRRLNEQHYVVELRGQTREVQSEHVLPVGETINAVVVSAADKLELRQLTNDNVVSTSVGETLTAMSSLVLPNQTDVATQANFYKCKLSKAELRTLQQAVDAAPDPSSMMLAGLFLSKHGMAIDPVALQQLYAQQTANVMSAAPAMQQDSKETDITLTVAGLAQALRTVVEIHAGEIMHSVAVPEKKIDAGKSISSAASGAVSINTEVPTTQARAADDATKDNDDNRKPVNISALHELLSDVDANGLGVRYGTLPVLINGELVELELVMFKHRQQQTNAEPIQRLVMSIHTQALGTVSITAEALNQRLLVNISTETTDQAETLGSYAADVRALAERFGWTVESVAYEVKSQSAKLSQRVMQHSIRQGVIDHVW